MPVAASPYEDAFVRGARLFDGGAFFEAHEAWEERWAIETDASARRFLQGLIQIAAAFHKLVASNSPESASRLLARGLARLDACPDGVAAHRLEEFRDALQAFERALAVGNADASAIPKIGR